MNIKTTTQRNRTNNIRDLIRGMLSIYMCDDITWVTLSYTGDTVDDTFIWMMDTILNYPVPKKINRMGYKSQNVFRMGFNLSQNGIPYTLDLIGGKLLTFNIKRGDVYVFVDQTLTCHKPNISFLEILSVVGLDFGRLPRVIKVNNSVVDTNTLRVAEKAVGKKTLGSWINNQKNKFANKQNAMSLNPSNKKNRSYVSIRDRRITPRVVE